MELMGTIAEGKTKIIVGTADPNLVLIQSKDDITAGDGAKHDLIENKAMLATSTTCNVFRLLKACEIPVAFTEQVSPTAFTAPRCNMLLWEVVVRREAHGSYLKRRPDLKKGHLFPRLLTEFFLKTSGRKWREYELPCDDPFADYDETLGVIGLYEPSKPIYGQKPFLTLREDEAFSVHGEQEHFEEMGEIARRVFLILEKAWQIEGRKLVDFKVEFGLTTEGKLLLADVIDNDSWRVIEDGGYIDKQLYRDGGELSDVAVQYQRVAEITKRFGLPVQQIVIWRGSDKDDIGAIAGAIVGICTDVPSRHIKVTTHTRSIHKEPVRGLNELHQLVQNIPDTVIIACIGRSNCAGPTLSAATTVPVITVPMSFKDFPEDVWSSLRTPSNVPVMTVLEPSNAALAALNILALRNPLLYMLLREKVETMALNMAMI